MSPELVRATIETGLLLLPEGMRSPRAVAFLGAIGWQESRWSRRWQIRGPARGYFQFERHGVIAVLGHPRLRPYVRAAIQTLNLASRVWPDKPDYDTIHQALAWHDPLAVVFARAVIWSHPGPLPLPTEADLGWTQYRALWRPGRPRPETWREAWAYGQALVGASREP